MSGTALVERLKNIGHFGWKIYHSNPQEFCQKKITEKIDMPVPKNATLVAFFAYINFSCTHVVFFVGDKMGSVGRVVCLILF
jgi:hypothetical protein